MTKYNDNTVRRLENVRIVIFRPTGKRLDIGPMTDSVTWSGDEETYSRQITVNFKNVIERRRGFFYYCGDAVVLYVTRFGKDVEVFRGMIYNTDRDHAGNESFTAYDNLFYLSKSNTTVLYKNINATDIIKKELKACGIPIGEIAKINYKIKKKVFEGTSREEVVREVLEQVEANTGKKYKLITEKGKASLIERKNAARHSIYLTYLNSGTNSMSIEDIATQVMITKNGVEDSKFVKFSKTNKTLAEKYGYIQHVINADEKATSAQMKKQMDLYLAKHSSPSTQVSINSIGDIKCKTGRKVEFYDQMAKAKNTLYISADSHTFSGGTHTMDLQLSTRLE